MKRLVLFAILSFFAVGTSRAQQVPNAPIGTTQDKSEAQAANTPRMTPREIAQMRADILMARKDYGEAAKAYQDLLKDDPKNAVLLNKTGLAYQLIGDPDQAERFYKKAMRADKTSWSAINNLGTVEYARERYGKAIKYFKKAIAGGDSLAAVYSNLAYAYCGIKDYPRAMEAFSKALAIDPQVFERRGSGGVVVQQRSAPDPAALHFYLAKSYAKAGEAEGAARYLKMCRDEGYKDFLSAQNDPDFARVIKDPRVQEVLRVRPPYAPEPAKPVQN
ncbi:MAG TPA: tetratricopeptide repeat protein [Candidatus Acidoferrales bacterium]|nr:tetratricopeptide repeat protein [Candidatus Acidoferrales bacterium]